MSDEFKPKTKLIPIPISNEFIPIVFKKTETVDLENKIKSQLNNNLYHNDINAVTKDLKILFDTHYKNKQNNNPDHKKLGVFVYYYILKSNKNKKHWRILTDFVKNYPKTISINAIKKLVSIGQIVIELNDANVMKFEDLVYLPYSEICNLHIKYTLTSNLNSNDSLKILKSIYDVMKIHFEK
jgi:hypothetical protein